MTEQMFITLCWLIFGTLFCAGLGYFLLRLEKNNKEIWIAYYKAQEEEAKANARSSTTR